MGICRSPQAAQNRGNRGTRTAALGQAPQKSMCPNLSSYQRHEMAYNFTSEHSITLAYPLDRCMQVLASPESLEPVMALNSLARNIQISKPECIAPASLRETRDTQLLPTATEGIERTAFSMEEMVPLLFGLYTRTVVIKGVQTWDKEQQCCLYESQAHGPDVTIHKLREFADLGGGKTQVKERIEGLCSKYLKGIVEKECRNAHQ